MARHAAFRGKSWADMTEEDDDLTFSNPFAPPELTQIKEKDEDKQESPAHSENEEEEDAPPVKKKSKKKKPRTYSRRAAFRKANASRIEQERLEKVRIAKLLFLWRVAFICVTVMQRTLRRARARILRRKNRPKVLRRLRELRLRYWIARCRTKAFLAKIECHSIFFFMDANFLRHLFTTLRQSILEHPRYVKQKNALPDGVTHALATLDEATSGEVDHTYKRPIKGQMVWMMRRVKEHQDTIKGLRLASSICKHFRSPQIKELVKQMHAAFDRRVDHWKIMMQATLTLIQRVPVEADTSDSLLAAAIQRVTPPCHPKDATAILWGKMVGVPPLFGLPSADVLARHHPRIRVVLQPNKKTAQSERQDEDDCVVAK